MQNFGEKTREKRPLGRRRKKCVEMIKKEMGSEDGK
jgi:hypothetical protein